MIVCELQPSGFTYAATKASDALAWAKGYLDRYPSTAVRLFDFGEPGSRRGCRNQDVNFWWPPETLTVAL